MIGVSTPSPGKLGEQFLHSKMPGYLLTLLRTLGRHSWEKTVSSYVKTTENQVNNKQMHSELCFLGISEK